MIEINQLSKRVHFTPTHASWMNMVECRPDPRQSQPQKDLIRRATGQGRT
jgi:hypothetical protein